MNSKLKQILTLLLSVCVVFAFSSVAAFADGETEAPLEYTGENINVIKADGTGFGMFTPQEGTECNYDGEVHVHYVPKNKTVYNGLHWGKIDDEELTKDVAFNDDGTFDLTLSKDNCGKLIPIAPIKAENGATTTTQYYLAVPSLYKIAGVLTVTNNTGMFKALSAKHKIEDGKESLVIALSGSGYHELFKGTYEEAVSNGDNRDNWIHGYQNADNKWEFEVPIDKEDSFIPIVAISDSYVKKYDQGLNSLERAFFPRQMELDREAGTLVTGDY